MNFPTKTYDRNLNTTNITKDKANILTKEKAFNTILEYSTTYFKENINKPQGSWINFCLRQKATNELPPLNSAKTNEEKAKCCLNQLGKNTSSKYWGFAVVLPKSFQQALAIEFIARKGIHAFSTNKINNKYAFDFANFKEWLQKDCINTIEGGISTINLLTSNLTEKYFQDISCQYQFSTEKDIKSNIPMVTFTNTREKDNPYCIKWNASPWKEMEVKDNLSNIANLSIKKNMGIFLRTLNLHTNNCIKQKTTTSLETLEAIINHENFLTWEDKTQQKIFAHFIIHSNLYLLQNTSQNASKEVLYTQKYSNYKRFILNNSKNDPQNKVQLDLFFAKDNLEILKKEINDPIFFNKIKASLIGFKGQLNTIKADIPKQATTIKKLKQEINDDLEIYYPSATIVKNYYTKEIERSSIQIIDKQLAMALFSNKLVETKWQLKNIQYSLTGGVFKPNHDPKNKEQIKNTPDQLSSKFIETTSGSECELAKYSKIIKNLPNDQDKGIISFPQGSITTSTEESSNNPTHKSKSSSFSKKIIAKETNNNNNNVNIKIIKPVIDNIMQDKIIKNKISKLKNIIINLDNKLKKFNREISILEENREQYIMKLNKIQHNEEHCIIKDSLLQWQSNSMGKNNINNININELTWEQINKTIKLQKKYYQDLDANLQQLSILQNQLEQITSLNNIVDHYLDKETEFELVYVVDPTNEDLSSFQQH